MIIDELFESPQQCPECGGISFSDLILAEKKDACYHKVKASAKVWPSAYASGRLVQCRKKGAANYGKSKTESVSEGVGNIGDQIKAVYQKIYDQGDDAVEFMYYDSPIFAQYWDEYEGDLDSIIAEVDPGELQIIHDELLSAAEQQDVAEGSKMARADKSAKAPKPKNQQEYDAVEKYRKDLAQSYNKEPNFGIKDDEEENKWWIDYDLDEGVAEAYQFKGGFPFDVDHMNGPRGINLPSVETKKYFTDKQQWAQAVDELNHSLYDDNSMFTGVTGRSTVAIDGREWARWSDAQQKGYVETKSLSQGMAEGSLEEDKGMKQYWAFKREWRAKHGANARVPSYDSKEYNAYCWRQGDKQQGVAEGSLEEVSQQTLQSYRKKASAQKRAADDVVSGDADDETWKKNVSLSAKRRQGIDAANKRLGVAETRRGQVPMTLNPGETDNVEPENIAGFRQLPAYKQGQAAQQKAGKQLIQKSPYTFQSDQDWAFRQGATDAQRAAMFANFGKSKPFTTTEGEQQKGADYRDPKEVDYDGEYDAMVARVKKLAGLGPMKTVYDPNKRVYRNMPTAVQPKK